MAKMAECQRKANAAINRHQIAMQAFQVACARSRWPDAEREQAAALDELGANLDAVQAIYRLRADMDET